MLEEGDLGVERVTERFLAGRTSCEGQFWKVLTLRVCNSSCQVSLLSKTEIIIALLYKAVSWHIMNEGYDLLSKRQEAVDRFEY